MSTNRFTPPDPLHANRLLAALPDEEFAALRPQLTIVDFVADEVLVPADAPVRTVYFPLTGVASIVASDEEGDHLEVGTIGREGLAGIAAFHEADSGPLVTVCQIAGDFAPLPADALRAAAVPGTALYRLLHRFSRATHILTTQSAACNRFHDLAERCARWLLLSHDRVGRDVFPLTHEYLSFMLGTRRPSVTVAMGILQRAGLISYQRGLITILDRDGLENATCECYGIITREYARLLGPAHSVAGNGHSGDPRTTIPTKGGRS